MNWSVYPIKDFPRLSQQWDALIQSHNYPSFMESCFMQPLIDEFGTGNELIGLLFQDNELRAGVILSRLGMGRWQTFLPSQLPLGACIFGGDLGIEYVAKTLIKKLPGLPLTIGFVQQDQLFQKRTPDSEILQALDYIETSWVEIAGEFDAYWEARGKNLKQNTKKQRNKLATENIETTLECITDPALVKQAFVDYGALESLGWKAKDGTAIHPDNAQGRFYTQAFEKLCSQGRGRIYSYSFGDKVVSMDLCIESGANIIILKTAYDESYKTLSPSTLMRQEQFRQLFEESRFKRIEFYGKTMEWHTRWTDLNRPIYHTNFYRWKLVKKLIGLRNRVKSKQPVPTGSN
jgi:hypothetical protein